MKAFFASLLVMAGIGLGADALLGGPVFNTGGIVVQKSAADVYKSSNVRLD